MEQPTTTTKTAMQELIDIILQTSQLLSKDEKFKDYDYTLNVEAVINLLKNSYELEATIISNAFDYGYLQAELKENAIVTNGSEYVKKFYTKDESISSKI